MHGGLRMLKRGEDKPQPVTAPKNDTFVEELEEFAVAVRGGPAPEVGGEYATESLAVVRAESSRRAKGARLKWRRS